MAKPGRPSRDDQIDEHLAVVFTPEMGARVAWFRRLACPLCGVKRKRYRSYYERPKCECISQLDLASKLSISQTSLSRIEDGKNAHSSISYRLFRSVFGKSADYILLERDLDIHEPLRAVEKRNAKWRKEHLDRIAKESKHDS